MSATRSATRVATTSVTGRRRAAATRARPAMCPQRRVRADLSADLRAKRHHTDGRDGSALRPGAGRPVDPAVYRRRRRLVGLAVAIAVIVLTLGAQATFTDSGSGPASAAGVDAVAPERTVRAMP